jgi:hypothetical protein
VGRRSRRRRCRCCRPAHRRRPKLRVWVQRRIGSVVPVPGRTIRAVLAAPYIHRPTNRAATADDHGAGQQPWPILAFPQEPHASGLARLVGADAADRDKRERPIAQRQTIASIWGSFHHATQRWMPGPDSERWQATSPRLSSSTGGANRAYLRRRVGSDRESPARGGVVGAGLGTTAGGSSGRCRG